MQETPLPGVFRIKMTELIIKIIISFLQKASDKQFYSDEQEITKNFLISLFVPRYSISSQL